MYYLFTILMVCAAALQLAVSSVVFYTVFRMFCLRVGIYRLNQSLFVISS